MYLLLSRLDDEYCQSCCVMFSSPSQAEKEIVPEESVYNQLSILSLDMSSVVGISASRD